MISPPDKVRLMAYLMRQDDPKKCTSTKLCRLGLAQSMHRASKIPRRAVVLDPFAQDLLAPSDREEVLRGGLLAIDCSWKNADEVFRKRFPGLKRRLPRLLAGNPTNYARIGILSSAEALAASLSILDFRSQAREVLSKFKWGSTFLSLNKEPLESYGLANSRSEVEAAERDYF